MDRRAVESGRHMTDIADITDMTDIRSNGVMVSDVYFKGFWLHMYNERSRTDHV